MTRKTIFVIALAGLALALATAYVTNIPKRPQAPLFDPASNPYAQGIYANGIIESDQDTGSNINVYPEVAGPVKRVFVKEGDEVRAGAPLFWIDDATQRATAAQQSEQAKAALAMLNELKAQPRKETLAVATAQVEEARAQLKMAQDQYAKQRRLHDVHPDYVSQDVVDNARNAVDVASRTLDVAQRQLQLVSAGAWSYEIDSQQGQYSALAKAADASASLLSKYFVRAPADGVVLAINASVGSYASPQGVYATYTQAFVPPVVVGSARDSLAVRCYIDEILVHRLPTPDHIRAEMTLRGPNLRLPLEFVRVQPYVTPKIDLSNQRLERVDVRVLAAVFRFKRPDSVNVYPGELVDVYIGSE